MRFVHFSKCTKRTKTIDFWSHENQGGVQLPNDEITQITLNIDTNLIKNGSN